MSIFRISSLVANDIVSTGGLALSSGYGLRMSTGRVQVLQGIIPTQSEINNAVFPFRDTDMLIEVASNVIMTYGSGKIGWNQQIVAATNSGTAGWFMWHGSPTAVGVRNIIVGTITAPGGGGDMTLTDLNIVAGNNYALGTANFTFPREFNY